MFRKVVFWGHLILGITAGSVLLVMAATGALLSFERQITEFADTRAVGTVSASANQTPLSVEALHAKLREAQPGARPTGMQFYSDPQRPAVFQFGRERSVFIDPYSGVILGEGAKGTRAFFSQVTALHRWLALSGDARKFGQSITSASALAFAVVIPSGLILWIPRRWTRKGVSAMAIPKLKLKLKGRARDWNWHLSLGLWSALPVTLMCVTGLIMAYPWANKLLFSAVGETPPSQRERGEGPPPSAQAGQGNRPQGREAGAEGRPMREGREGGERGAGGPPGERGPGGRPPQQGPEKIPAGVDAAVQVARSFSKDWREIQFSFPREKSLSVFVADDQRGRPDRRTELSVDLTSQQIKETKTMAQQSKGRQLRTWVRWLHTGEALGAPGQFIAGFGSFCTVVLVVTGFALSFRRLRSWRKKRSLANTAG
jgi:uncharacterized iron-regulated membrane protein